MSLPTMFDLLQSVSSTEFNIKSYYVPRVPGENESKIVGQKLSPKEEECLGILQALGGKASTSEVSKKIKGYSANALYHLRKLESKGKVREMSRKLDSSTIPTIYWSLTDSSTEV